MDTPGWTSIRPWIPPLTLSVREITSVSVTFILSASSAPLAGEPDIAALLEDIQHRGEDEADGDEEDNSTSNSESEAKKPSSSPPSVVSRALAGGLSVEVDRGSWRRVFIRIDDKADEAVIIVYGLMPGRQYDVDLELVQGQTTMRSQVVTQGATCPVKVLRNRKILMNTIEDNNPSNGTPVEADTSTTPTGNADESTPTRPSTPPNTASTPSQSSSSQQHAQPSGTSFSFAPLTLEDRIAQLQHTLSLLNSETTTLTASLKSARRDSQKADAALRTEIEVLRRASERHNAGELRAKQKVLALQEAVKRANSSVTETKSETQQTEEAYPELESERNAKEKEHARVLAEAEKMRAEREREEEVVRKRIDGYKSELNALCKTQEKLETKQEKVENGTVKELQEKLDLVERELEELELEESMAYALAQAGARPLGPSLGIGLGSIGQPNRPLNIPEIPSTVITRPLAGPIGLPRPPPKTSSIPSANSKVSITIVLHACAHNLSTIGCKRHMSIIILFRTTFPTMDTKPPNRTTTPEEPREAIVLRPFLQATSPITAIQQGLILMGLMDLIISVDDTVMVMGTTTARTLLPSPRPFLPIRTDILQRLLRVDLYLLLPMPCHPREIPVPKGRVAPQVMVT
ncbi:hypothetical protein V5O48_005901 [Marasmius crinis-equi]|uniref:Uncharacterized protein n=1 Tax=Marasmius crinis-equi TaxID=585013 RepID=A0ABR3FL72_9AGAR